MDGERWWNRKIPAWKVEWALFALALIALALLPFPRMGFVPQGLHGFVSAHGLTLAAHLSPEHHFLTFNTFAVDAAGNERLDSYSRFPATSFMLVRAATALAGDDLLDQIVWAQKLMWAFMLGAMFCAYRAFRRLRPGSWAVPVAVLLAFSSKYCLFFGDMVFNDVPELFGCMLTFHGFVVYWQEKRFGQLLAKALVAVALGWQIFAMVFPLALFMFLSGGNRKDAIRLASAAFAFGALLVTVNVAQEYMALNRTLLELPSVESALGRTGLYQSEQYIQTKVDPDPLSNVAFVKQQMQRVVFATIPAYTSAAIDFFYGFFAGKSFPKEMNGKLFAILAVPMVVAVFLLFAFLCHRRKIPVTAVVPLVSLALFWSFPMKNFTADHEFQGLFWIGVPLLFYDAVLSLFGKRSKVFPIALMVVLTAGMNAFLRASEEKTRDSAESAARLVMLESQRQVFADGAHPKIFVWGIRDEAVGAWHGPSFALPQAAWTKNIEHADYVLCANSTFIGEKRDGAGHSDFCVKTTVADTAYAMYTNFVVEDSVLKDAGLPVIYIQTSKDAKIQSKERWTTAKMRVKGSGNTEWDFDDVDIQIRGRGNSTWGQTQKKPFSIKLGTKKRLIGMPANKKWVLLANYLDNSFIKNQMAFYLSRRFGMDYTVKGEYVNLVLNGNYVGLYWLGETVKNAANLKKRAARLLEVDVNYDEEWKFRSPTKDFPYMVKTDKGMDRGKLDSIRDEVGSIERLLYDGASRSGNANDSLLERVDLESFAKHYVVNEIMRNYELKHPKSLYLVLDGGKLMAGPVWDFDWSCGTTAQDLNLQEMGYYDALVEIPEFEKKVGALLADSAVTEKEIAEEVETLRKHIGKSVALDTRRWGWKHRNRVGVERPDFDAYVDDVRDCIVHRLDAVRNRYLLAGSKDD